MPLCWLLKNAASSSGASRSANAMAFSLHNARPYILCSWRYTTKYLHSLTITRWLITWSLYSRLVFVKDATFLGFSVSWSSERHGIRCDAMAATTIETRLFANIYPSARQNRHAHRCGCRVCILALCSSAVSPLPSPALVLPPCAKPAVVTMVFV